MSDFTYYRPGSRGLSAQFGMGTLYGNSISLVQVAADTRMANGFVQ